MLHLEPAVSKLAQNKFFVPCLDIKYAEKNTFSLPPGLTKQQRATQRDVDGSVQGAGTSFCSLREAVGSSNAHKTLMYGCTAGAELSVDG